MPEEINKDVLLDDPLSEVTRKERRMLLGVSVLTIALIKTGLIPTKISALGVEFSETNQKALLGVVSLVDIYFLLAFLVYALADFLAWRKALAKHNDIELQKRYDEQIATHSEDEVQVHNLSGYGTGNYLDELKKNKREDRDHFIKGITMVHKLSGPVSISRAFFEFALPVIVGIYSLFLIWQH